MSTILTRWNPLRETEEFQNRLLKALGFPQVPTITSGEEFMTTTQWAPFVDIVEDDKEWLVKADLPEVKKDDVKVTVENGVLTITGSSGPTETSCAASRCRMTPMARR